MELTSHETHFVKPCLPIQICTEQSHRCSGTQDYMRLSRN